MGIVAIDIAIRMRINVHMIDAPMKLIRKSVFRIGQAEMAAIAGAAQATVSRWERGELEPDREQMAKIRAAAADRSLDWRDEWFFDVSSIPSEVSS